MVISPCSQFTYLLDFQRQHLSQVCCHSHIRVPLLALSLLNKLMGLYGRSGQRSVTCLQSEAGQQGRRSVEHRSVHSQLISSVVLSDCQVEAEKGAESVQLPFRTAPELLKGTKVMWWRYEPGPVLRVFEHLGEEPHQLFKNRIKMKEDFLSTGDLSLTLSHVTDELFGSYRCGVYKRGKILMWTTVHLKEKGLLSLVVFVLLAECL